MNDIEFIFDEVIDELPERTIQLNNIKEEFNLVLENMLLYSSTDDLSAIIHNKISKDIENLSNKITDCNNWITNYKDNLEVLSNGLNTGAFSDILEFNQAKNIIDSEFI